jgi:pilus assembly protein CpaE
VLNRADAKVGLDRSDAEEALRMKIACAIPESRDLPLALNLGLPVVLNSPKSAAAKQLQQLSRRFAPDVEAKSRKERRR